MARPTLCTPDLTERVKVMIQGGAPPQAATMANGISRAAYREWCAIGRAAIAGGRPSAEAQPYVAFVEMIDQAEGFAEVRATMKALGSTPASTLKHRFGDRALHAPPADKRPRSWMEAAFPDDPQPAKRRAVRA